MTPYADYVLVQMRSPERGLRRATVIAKGDGTYAPDGTLQPPRVSAGQNILLQPLISSAAGDEIVLTQTAGQPDQVLVRESRIVAIDD